MEARIKVSGLPKGEYMVRCLLNSQINITTGKYQSDRLSLELKRLRESLEKTGGDPEVVEDCKALLEELLSLMQTKRMNEN